jgi:hypothetical protein
MDVVAIFFVFFFDMFTQKKWEGRFELMISASLGIVHNRLSYLWELDDVVLQIFLLAKKITKSSCNHYELRGFVIL